MQTQKTKNDPEYRNIAVGLLEESPTNPRKWFDENTLKELAASIKSQGLLEPLLVRGRGQEQGRYEVVVGARRLRAAKLAGLEAVPVRVVALTDAQTIEAQVVENLQREDIHPLEEAMGFRSLLGLKDPNYTVSSIAARAGKSEAYVLGRIKLTELIPPVAERVSAPLKKADLLTIAEHVISRLPYSQAPLVAKRHRIEIKSGDAAPEQLVKQIAQYDEAGLSRLLLEISLLDSAYQRSPDSKKDRLLETATRYRVDIGKLQKAVAAEMAAKREKKHGARKTKTA